MTRNVWIPLCVILLVPGLASAQPAKADVDWQPRKTWVFTVGVLEWKDGKTFGSFPKKDRRDAELVEFFKKQGVPGEQVVYLQDREATLEKIDKELPTLLAKAQKGDLFVLYYGGHGSRINAGTGYFANYDATADITKTGWAIPAIFDAIEKHYKGGRALLIGECCNSGTLAVEAAKRKGKIDYAVLASAHANSLSTGNWTFADCLLAGLRGDPRLDLNGDGAVALDEIVKYTEGVMVFEEDQMPVSYASKGFGSQARLALRSGKKPEGEPGKAVEVEWRGQWYKARILKADGKKTRIHYVGYPDSDDESVTADRIREYKPEVITAGTKVSVEWEGKWYPAKVLEAKGGLHLIRYDNYSEDWDEWVTAKRIKK